jgi:hypothetical protein
MDPPFDAVEQDIRVNVKLQLDAVKDGTPLVEIVISLPAQPFGVTQRPTPPTGLHIGHPHKGWPDYCPRAFVTNRPLARDFLWT